MRSAPGNSGEMRIPMMPALWHSSESWRNRAEIWPVAESFTTKNAYANAATTADSCKQSLAYRMLQNGENVDVALTLAQTARQGMPNSTSAADTLAWAYYYKGTYGFARDLLKLGKCPPCYKRSCYRFFRTAVSRVLAAGGPALKVDVRVIAATNIDIKAAIAQKTFREDLYYRLNGLTIKVPPLRDRVQEIPVLSEHFMHKAAARFECDLLPISPSLMRCFSKIFMAGQVFVELENVIKRYLVLGDEAAIIHELSHQESDGLPILDMNDKAGGGAGLKHLVRNLKGGAESAAIAQTLEGTGWNRKAAANELQISYARLFCTKSNSTISPRH